MRALSESSEHLDWPPGVLDHQLAGLVRLRTANAALASRQNLDELLASALRAALVLVGGSAGALTVLRTEGRYCRSSAVQDLDEGDRALVEDALRVGGVDLDTLPGPTDRVRRGSPTLRVVAVPVPGARCHLLVEGLGHEPVPDDELALLAEFLHDLGGILEGLFASLDSARREQWLRATAECSRRLLTGQLSQLDFFDAMAGQMMRLLEARAVLVILPLPETADGFEIVSAVGAGIESLTGHRYQSPHSQMLRLMAEQRPVSVDYTLLPNRAPMPLPIDFGPVLLVPLASQSGPRGAVVAARLPGQQPFSHFDEQVSSASADQAAMVLEVAASRQKSATIAVLEDRERVAASLQDNVIQNLFATNLGLQASLRFADAEIRDRLEHTVAGIDQAISQVRQAIHTLSPSSADVPASTGLLATIRQLSEQHGFEPRVVFSGTREWPGLSLVLSDVELALEEALTNVAKHAGAEHVEVEVRTAPRELEIVVTDDGAGMADPTARGGGLRALAERAERLSGWLTLSPVDGGGTRLSWYIQRP